MQTEDAHIGSKIPRCRKPCSCGSALRGRASQSFRGETVPPAVFGPYSHTLRGSHIHIKQGLGRGFTIPMDSLVS